MIFSAARLERTPDGHAARINGTAQYVTECGPIEFPKAAELRGRPLETRRKLYVVAHNPEPRNTLLSPAWEPDVIELQINGQAIQVDDPSTPLLWVIREQMKLTGTSSWLVRTSTPISSGPASWPTSSTNSPTRPARMRSRTA